MSWQSPAWAGWADACGRTRRRPVRRSAAAWSRSSRMATRAGVGRSGGFEERFDEMPPVGRSEIKTAWPNEADGSPLSQDIVQGSPRRVRDALTQHITQYLSSSSRPPHNTTSHPGPSQRPSGQISRANHSHGQSAPHLPITHHSLALQRVGSSELGLTVGSGASASSYASGSSFGTSSSLGEGFSATGSVPHLQPSRPILRTAGRPEPRGPHGHADFSSPCSSSSVDTDGTGLDRLISPRTPASPQQRMGGLATFHTGAGKESSSTSAEIRDVTEGQIIQVIGAPTRQPAEIPPQVAIPPVHPPPPHHPTSLAHLTAYFASLFPYHATAALSRAHLLEVTTAIGGGDGQVAWIGAVVNGLPCSSSGRRSSESKVMFVHLPPLEAASRSGQTAGNPLNSGMFYDNDDEDSAGSDALALRDILTALLDLADALHATRLVLTLRRNEREDEDLRALLHALAYVGGEVLHPPVHPSPIPDGAPSSSAPAARSDRRRREKRKGQGLGRGCGWEWDEREWIVVGIDV